MTDLITKGRFELDMEFERRRNEQLELHRGSEIVTKIGEQSGAVCRLNGRGSGILISRDLRRLRESKENEPLSTELGVILTCPSVLPDEDTAKRTTAIFKIALPGRLQSEWESCEVRLLPSLFFYTSVTDCQSSPVGYTLVACELLGKGGRVKVKPLRIPLSPPYTRPVSVGDLVLVIQHPNGYEGRKYHVTNITETHNHFATHSKNNCTPDYVSSGGAFFNDFGEFIGVGHMSDGISILIFLKDIVNHMVRSSQISNFEIRFLDTDPSLSDQFNSCGYPLFEEDSHIDPSDNVNPLFKYSLPGVYWFEIWESWFNPEIYESIIMLLKCFAYNTEIVQHGLIELTCHSQRENICLLAELDGLSVIINIITIHWEDETIVTQAVSTLSRSSDDADNLSVLEDFPSLLPILISILRTFSSPRVLQWSLYVLLNLVSKASNCEAAKDRILSSNAMELIKTTISTHETDTYIVKWGCQLLSAIVSDSEDFMKLACDIEIPVVVFSLRNVDNISEEPCCIEAVLLGLCTFTKDSTLQCVRDLAVFLNQGGVIQYISESLTTYFAKEEIAYYCAILTRNVILAYGIFFFFFFCI